MAEERASKRRRKHAGGVGCSTSFTEFPLWRSPGALPTSEMLDPIIEFVSHPIEVTEKGAEYVRSMETMMVLHACINSGMFIVPKGRAPRRRSIQALKWHFSVFTMLITVTVLILIGLKTAGEVRRSIDAIGGGKSLDGMNSRAIITVQDFYKAYEKTAQWEGRDALHSHVAPRVTETRIMELHAIAMSHAQVPDIGKYRTGDVEVAGELKPAHHLVAGLMQELLEKTNYALEVLYRNSEAIAVKVRDVIVVASDFFHRFENVHPFWDGNGRVGRLLLTYLLYPVTRYFPFNFLKDYGGRPKAVDESIMMSNRLYRTFLAEQAKDLAAGVCEGVYVGCKAFCSD